ncbi:murein hydrolase activator EnvC family protein [Zafaria sp. Z1313]|uniref:murein hydrolase activator EnvC family protein n=1 Tax=Zafaria sp. Z1313 TaxID=3423202 RepID=UPI003D302369
MRVVEHRQAVPPGGNSRPPGPWRTGHRGNRMPGAGRRAPAVLLAAALALLGTASAAAPSEPTAAPTGSWAWPVGGPAGPRVLEGFDPPPKDWMAGHRGADLASSPGTPVVSPAAGRVAFAGIVVDRPVVTVDHGNGLVTSLEPVETELEVGAVLARGQPLGAVGSGGHCGSSCVHWGLRLDGEYIDPLDTVGDRRPSVLLPLPPGGR